MRWRILIALALPAMVAAQKPGWSVSYVVPKRQADDLRSVHFLTRHEGWAVGDGYDNYTGIYHTTDGGQSWQRLELYDAQPRTPDWAMVRFADAKHGWIAPRLKNTMLRTTDGGESWEPVEMSRIDNVQANDMLTMGPSGVLIAADRGLIHMTIDGGKTWEHAQLKDKNDEPSGNDAVSLAAAGRTLYVASMNDVGAEGRVHRSQDGGRTWRLIFEAPQNFGAVAFRDENNGVVLGKGVAYWTADGGETWKKTIAPGKRTAARYLDNNTIVAVGEMPAVLISRDGGRTWRAGPQPPGLNSTALADLNVVDPGWWYAPSDRPAQLFAYFDPEYDAIIGSSTMVLPAAVRIGTSPPLPPGMYDVSIVHDGLEHVMLLTLEKAAPGVQTGVKAAKLSPKQYACDPCEATIPVDAEYETADATIDPAAVMAAEAAAADPTSASTASSTSTSTSSSSSSSSSTSASDPTAAAATDPIETMVNALVRKAKMGVRLEPTATGFDVVLDVSVPPPASAVGALAMLGITGAEQDVDAKKTGGSLRDRLKKAASGDLKGAVSGLNPKAAADRKAAAELSKPELYHVKLRYPLKPFQAPQ